jgi:hypothetical protein
MTAREQKEVKVFVWQLEAMASQQKKPLLSHVKSLLVVGYDQEGHFCNVKSLFLTQQMTIW